MPIYEYQCEKCGRTFNFLVRSVTSHKPPACPKCGVGLMTRVLSRFAAPKRAGKKSRDEAPRADGSTPGMPSGGPELPPGMENLMAEAEGMDESDPRAMGRFMRKMADQSGDPVPPEMHEMIRRLESGEDPEKIEEQMGDVLGDEAGGGPGGGDTLYDG